MEPKVDGLAVVVVRASEVEQAIARGRAVSDDWQAGLLEIALIPAVAERFAEVNRGAAIERHEGLPHIGMRAEDNRQVSDWSVYAGYVVSGWNRVGDEQSGFSHGAGRAWDGVRRSCWHGFVEAIRNAFLHQCMGARYMPNVYEDQLARYRVMFENDLQGAEA